MPTSSRRIKLVVTDLDGTLFDASGRVSAEDEKSLEQLGKIGVIRAIATGRSPYSFAKVIGNDFPIDYLVFSSGAGTMRWDNREILYTTELTPNEVQNVVDELMSHQVDFMVHEPIPANHRFLYHQTQNHNPDFDRRIELYKHFCQPYIPGVPYGSSAAQILAVLPHNVDWFEKLRRHFPALKVIRATSPLDGHSIWMEIFRKDVSKAFGIQKICELHGIKPDEVVTVGNDFNDLDMLSHYQNSFVVANAPEELLSRFTNVKSNSHSGFSDAVSRLIESSYNPDGHP